MVATANEVGALPPELLRKGRFDEIFFVDLPSKEERREIFTIHIEKRKRSVENYDLDTLVRETEGWSGAEIEQAILSAMYSAFSQKQDGRPKEFTTGDIQAAVNSSIPLSVTRKEEIKTLREWAKQRARPTSAEPVVASGGGRILEM